MCRSMWRWREEPQLTLDDTSRQGPSATINKQNQLRFRCTKVVAKREATKKIFNWVTRLVISQFEGKFEEKSNGVNFCDALIQNGALKPLWISKHNNLSYLQTSCKCSSIVQVELALLNFDRFCKENCAEFLLPENI